VTLKRYPNGVRGKHFYEKGRAVCHSGVGEGLSGGAPQGWPGYQLCAACRWLKPRLVAQIGFTDGTEANHLRHSRFAGLRGGKDPREVRREYPA
jgi:hypothetical protein